ncbi:hypothetical protein [Sphingomonas sp.]|uniref:hypothetical protein n=1 Tax=Sphingomonas sp. TaxID=28214 RepID=UPI0025D8D053|nr:hypothetical protein [Sphingomonas sp.]MBV9529244.1 hypothetical protein [Sphingomonas sp.]
MSDAFQPRFVDLVRNYSISQGTGPFVLGPPVQGFSSFASALKTGDQFYYSAIGIDKPNEREVGRGTLQSDGSIARAAIAGAPTSFTAGSKSIALIAAAEWFNNVQAGAGTGAAAQAAATRTALAATAAGAVPVQLTEKGREGTFLFDSSNLSAKVSADSAQGIYVAPSSDASGASGAWVRKFSGAVDVRWFGAVADDTGTAGTDNGPAFAAAIAFLNATSSTLNSTSKGSRRLIASGAYYLGTTTLELTHTLMLSGDGPQAATKLRWADNTTGIRIERYNTQGATAVSSPTHYGGDNSVIENMTLYGGFTDAESESHAIHMRAAAIVRNVQIYNFGGDGIHIEATSGGGVPQEGNANVWRVEYCNISLCRIGLFIDGADTNAGVSISVNAFTNRQAHTWDSSFLNNTHIAAQSSGNGVVAWCTGAAGHPATACSYNGNRYYVKLGQSAGASTNAPTGTTADNAYWGYLTPGAVRAGYPAWVSGMTCREGSAFLTDNANARIIFDGCYSEQDHGPSQLGPLTLVRGGFHGAGIVGTGTVTEVGSTGCFTARGAIGKNDPFVGNLYTIGEYNVEATLLRAVHPTYAPNSWRMAFGVNGGAKIRRRPVDPL